MPQDEELKPQQNYVDGVEEIDEILRRGSKRETKTFAAAGEEWRISKKRIRKIAFTCHSGRAQLDIYRSDVVRMPEFITAGVHENYTLDWGTAEVVFKALEPSVIYMHVEWDK